MSIQNERRKTGYAWGRYFEECNKNHKLQVEIYEKQNNIIEEIPIHLVKELQELNNKLKIKIECPICFSIIADEKLKVSVCGHKYCIDCYNHLDSCAICRMKFKK